MVLTSHAAEGDVFSALGDLMALAKWCCAAYRHWAVPYPNFPEKHVGAPLVTPQRLLDYARAVSNS